VERYFENIQFTYMTPEHDRLFGGKRHVLSC